MRYYEIKRNGKTTYTALFDDNLMYYEIVEVPYQEKNELGEIVNLTRQEFRLQDGVKEISKQEFEFERYKQLEERGKR